jgi:hypothetical protein
MTLALMMSPEDLAVILQDAVKTATEPLERKIEQLQAAIDEKEDESLTLNQTRKKLKRSRATVVKLLLDKSLQGTKRNGRWYILSSSVRQFQINNIGGA